MEAELAREIVRRNWATKEQVMVCWNRITNESSFKHLLAENGILTPRQYEQLKHALTHGTDIVEQQPEPASSSPSVAQSPADSVSNHAAPAPEMKRAESANASRPIVANDSAAIELKGSGPVAPPSAVSPASSFDEILAFARACHASDIHLSVDKPIMIRHAGVLKQACKEMLTAKMLQAGVEDALPIDVMERLNAAGDLEAVYALPECGRFRITFMKQRHGIDVTVRVVPLKAFTFEQLGLPESCRTLTKWAQGMVLVTGPAGCGKSTTLVTLVEMINQSRNEHIIAIENPIEYVYTPACCRITQRQVGMHTGNQAAALRAALRQDPDIIVISELRDLESIRLAVSAAETGHLVFSTMNTTNASRTILRLIDSFPPGEQEIVRNMVSESLRGVVSQQLIPRADGSGVVPAFETLIVTTAISNMIRKNEMHQLANNMIMGRSSGMVILDDALRILVTRGIIKPQEACKRATMPKQFESMRAGQ
ncbi:MAG: PilT/PilU family type 4a pilus ATPase [Chitinivibrionales bacterium]|nr:PilT/PilU family type 4a pilus ATPase [Chitinivibrionales bacterium]